jgi:AcrR family transcriptional regulator
MKAEGVATATTSRPPQGAEGEGLRERKKRMTRQLLSDTATTMFVERGFDAVRVAEIAEACAVSEKTVFNYFPTKESLLLDRLDDTLAALRGGLADPGVPPLAAVLRILAEELVGITSWPAGRKDRLEAIATFQRVGALIQSTPSLRAHQRDLQEQVIGVVAEILARRAGVSPNDPEPQIAAVALLGLWQIQFRALRTYLDGTRAPAQVREAVTAEVLRAARLVEHGLDAYPLLAAGPRT